MIYNSKDNNKNKILIALWDNKAVEWRRLVVEGMLNNVLYFFLRASGNLVFGLRKCNDYLVVRITLPFSSFSPMPMLLFKQVRTFIFHLFFLFFSLGAYNCKLGQDDTYLSE